MDVGFRPRHTFWFCRERTSWDAAALPDPFRLRPTPLALRLLSPQRGRHLLLLEPRARSSSRPRGSLLFVAVRGAFPVSPSFSYSAARLEAVKTPRIGLPG